MSTVRIRGLGSRERKGKQKSSYSVKRRGGWTKYPSPFSREGKEVKRKPAEGKGGEKRPWPRKSGALSFQEWRGIAKNRKGGKANKVKKGSNTGRVVGLDL